MSLILDSAFSRFQIDLGQQMAAGSLPQQQDHGTLASFISHTAYLEERLRCESSVFFDDRVRIKTESKCRLGSGASFLVERAEWTSSSNTPPISCRDGAPMLRSKPSYGVLQPSGKSVRG